MINYYYLFNDITLNHLILIYFKYLNRLIVYYLNHQTLIYNNHHLKF